MTYYSDKSLVEMRIHLLTSQHKVNIVKNCSPTLKDLREKNANNVKTCSDIYEKKPWSWKTGCNWWINEWKPQNVSPKVSLPSLAPNFNDAAKIKEMLRMEKDHISQLIRFIIHINGIIHDATGFIAMKLRENTFCLFGSLKDIHKLHKTIILPQMSRTIKCIDLIKTLIQLIDDGRFYCYISHKMLEQSMKKLHNEHMFLVQHDVDKAKPFEMLEIYKDWITDVCNELMKNPTKNADDVSFCLEAEKKFDDLMDSIADAESVSNILQISAIPINVQFSVYSVIKKHKHEVLDDPMLLLIPKKTTKFSYRYPIDIMQLGKFIKSFEFPMTSQEHGYMNDSRFFVFERCVIYTTVVNFGQSFSYENHFWMKDALFNLGSERIIAELKNFNHTIQVDNGNMVDIMARMRTKHYYDENTAEIEMSDRELMKIIDSVDEVKKWRRHSIVSIN